MKKRLNTMIRGISFIIIINSFIIFIIISNNWAQFYCKKINSTVESCINLPNKTLSWNTVTSSALANNRDKILHKRVFFFCVFSFFLQKTFHIAISTQTTRDKVIFRALSFLILHQISNTKHSLPQCFSLAHSHFTRGYIFPDGSELNKVIVQKQNWWQWQTKSHQY